jgi:hypothetical protein
MIIEQGGRRLLLIEDEKEWDRLPKDVRALPVYYRFTATGIDLWPMWPKYMTNPEIRVSP